MTGRRLIEEGLPFREINAESAKEKSAQRGHISAMHLWWARRPLSMSRAVVFGTLLPDPGEAARPEILREIALAAPFKASVKDSLLNPLRRRLRKAYSDVPPKVLDCFAGGGAIPLEALRLGCSVTALDLNPVAHLVERCVLEYPQRFGQPDATGKNAFADDFAEWAAWVRDRVVPVLTGVFSPGDSAPPAEYFWARTMECQNPGCRAEVPLLSSLWLANSKRRKVWVQLETNGNKIAIRVHTDAPPRDLNLSEGTVKASSATCPACSTSLKAAAVREYGKKVGFGVRLYAVLDIAGRERTYREPTGEEIEAALSVAPLLLGELKEAPDGSSPIPDEECDPNGFRRVQNIVFGYSTWRSLFTDRQLLVLGLLCQAVREAHSGMLARGVSPDRATALTTYLGLCVDRIADYNSSFCSAHVSLEAVRNTFPQQAIRMTWDFVEIFPFGKGPGNWDGATRWIESAIRHCSLTSTEPGTVVRGDAQQLPFDAESFDAVIVDPPYYDSIQYSYLSDFFYVWLKRSVGFLHPDLFATTVTPKRQEVIQNQAKKDSPDYISSDEFDRRLQRALAEIARVVKREGVVSIVFAHTEVAAWERLLRALREARLVVTTSWPMRSESANRTTASLQHAVLSSSVVLVCRPSRTTEEGFYDDVVRELEDHLEQRLKAFEGMQLVGADYFVSAVGPAFEIFAKYSNVVRLSGEEVDVSDLMVLARQTVARHAMRRLLGEESTQTLDGTSLLYLTWRWAYGAGAIPADEAYKMERAFDVDLSDLAGPHGLVHKAGSNFSLCGPEDRKGLKLGTNPDVIDVLHQACLLWDAGRRKELEALLADRGMATETSFWSLAGALAEVLPEGDRERTMLLGLTGNQEGLAHAAAERIQPEQTQML